MLTEMIGTFVFLNGGTCIPYSALILLCASPTLCKGFVCRFRRFSCSCSFLKLHNEGEARSPAMLGHDFVAGDVRRTVFIFSDPRSSVLGRGH